MTNPLLKYFRPNQKLSLFEKLKVSALINSGTFGGILAVVLLLSHIASPTSTSHTAYYSISTILVFIVLSFFILKKTSIQKAGNFFATGIVLIGSLSIALANNIDPLQKYTQTHFSLLALFTVGMLFASRKMMMINAGIILIAITKFHFYALHYNPELKNVYTHAFVQYLTTLIVIAIALFYFIKFSEEAISSENQQLKVQEKQNKQFSSINKLVKNIINQLLGISEKIRRLAGTLNASSEEQASSVEEMSAAIEEISSAMDSDSSFISSSTENVKNTLEFVGESKNAIQKALNAIQEMSKKLVMIQEIAAKTDILSINASIEAARAGNFGTGFSVVANEIKKLAEKSNTGAQSISESLNNTMEVAEDANNYLISINQKIQYVYEVFERINSTTKEQRDSLFQINNSIIAINSGAQQNNDISAELVEALQNLVDLSKKLENLIA